MDKLLNAQEVCVMIGTSPQTLSSWYRFKKLHPENQYACLIPEFTRIGNRHTRYWTQDDVWKLLQFKTTIPQGRNGVMGDVTQKYVKNCKKVLDL